MKKKIYILFNFLVVILSSFIAKIELQNDTFSAIKIGDYILKHGLDFKEHFNFDNSLAFHNARWLFNVIIGFIYNNFNFIGIYIFVILLSILLGLLVFNTLYKKSNSLLLSFSITALTMFYLSGFICARAQTISYILFFLEIVFIEKLLETNKVRYSIYLVIISVLVANIHTTVWPITIVLFLPYLAEIVLSKLVKGKILYSDIKNIKLFIITFIVVSISGLITPLGLLPYTYMFKTMSGLSTEFILELKPVNVFLTYNILLLFLLYLYLFLYKKVKIKISDLFLVTGLFILCLLASRNEPYFILLCVISLTRTIMNSFNNKKILNIDNKYINNKKIISLITIYILIISGFNFYVGIYKKDFVNKELYPVQASNYILKNLDLNNMRLYDDFNNGSYLEFRGIKVFVDSRSEVYCKEFNDTSILEDYYNLNYFKDYYKNILDKYNFTHLLIENNISLNLYIKNDNDYSIIYSDEYYTLYEKKEI